MKLRYDRIKRGSGGFRSTELSYNTVCFNFLILIPAFLMGAFFNPLKKDRWFCRVWHKDWLTERRDFRLNGFGESYGRTKWEAYRKAVKNLNT